MALDESHAADDDEGDNMWKNVEYGKTMYAVTKCIVKRKGWTCWFLGRL